MIARAFLSGWLMLATSVVSAQNDPADQARDALAALEVASSQLEDALKARDRVKALTATIQAMELGLGAMREGLRRASIRERVLNERLNGKEAEIANLLAALQSIGRRGGPEVLMHPSGALGTARAGMVLATLGPRLNAAADGLRADLQEVQDLRLLQEASSARMAAGLQDIQEARTALNQALAERTDLPSRFTADPTRTALLIASAETLDAFASGLGLMVAEEFDPPLKGEIEPGSLALPAQGIILRGPGEADLAGVVRPGLLLATRKQALVITPVAATIRYAGPLLDLDHVVVLEPSADRTMILAGMAQVYGSAGNVVESGTPVGIMGPISGENDELLSPSGDDTGSDRSETLYIEIRENNRPVDPTTWFATGPDK